MTVANVVVLGFILRLSISASMKLQNPFRAMLYVSKSRSRPYLLGISEKILFISPYSPAKLQANSREFKVFTFLSVPNFSHFIEQLDGVAGETPLAIENDEMRNGAFGLGTDFIHGILDEVPNGFGVIRIS